MKTNTNNTQNTRDAGLTYTLSFDLNGGSSDMISAFSPMYGKSGNSCYIPSITPYKGGHVFTGWTNISGYSYSPGQEYFFYFGNDTLTAQWSPIITTATVTFDANGGSGVPSSYTGDIGSTYNLPLPTRDGYIFTGWLDPDGNSYSYAQPYTLSHDVTLTAQWTVLIHSLSFDLNGGSGSFETQYVQYGTNILLPTATPTRPFASFSHWLSDTGDTYYPGDAYFFFRDGTLTAQWVLQLGSISFDLAGGSGDFPTIDGNTGIFVNLPSTTPTKPGFVFSHWATSSGTAFNPGDGYMIPYGNETLTAVWNVDTVTLTFDLAGGTGSFASQSAASGINIILSETVPTRDGFAFSHWVNSTDTTFAPGDPYFFVYGNDTLTAVWNSTVTFNYDGGTGNLTAVTLSEGSEYTLSELPTKTGYVFRNWLDTSGNEYALNTVYTFGANTTLTAVWKRTYTVTYLNADGSIFTTQKKYEGTPIAATELIPIKNNNVDGNPDYVFSHWITDPTNEWVYSGGRIAIDADITMRPVWAIQQILVFRDFDDNIIFVRYKTDDTDMTMPDEIPAKEGVEFVCWKSNVGENYYYPGDIYSADESMAFIPVGTSSGIKKIAYNVGGDTTLFPMQTASAGSVITVHSGTPSKDGYVFGGWSYEAAAEAAVPAMASMPAVASVSAPEVVQPGDTVTVQESFVLTPIWIKTYKIRYYDGNTFLHTQEIPMGTVETVGANIPSKEGKYFVCWKMKNKNVYYESGDAYTENRDCDLEGVWLDNGKTAFLYDTRRSETDIEMHVFDANTSASVTGTVPETLGRSFAGWRERNDSTLLLQPNAAIATATPRILDEEWEFDESVVISDKPEYNTLLIGHEAHVLSVDPGNMQISGLELTWRSNNERVAEVSQSGALTPKNAGTAVISVELKAPGSDYILFCNEFEVLVRYPAFSYRESVNPIELFMPGKSTDGRTEEEIASMKVEAAEVRIKALDLMNKYYLDPNNTGLREHMVSVGERVSVPESSGEFINEGTCIFAFEGLGDPSIDGLNDSNESTEHRHGLYNAMMVVTRGFKIVYVTRRASTLPDRLFGTKTDDKGTCVPEGIYDYYTGNHAGQYVALRRTPDGNTGWYLNGNQFVHDTCTGINIHAGLHRFFYTAGNNNSEGCQIVHYRDYAQFGRSVGFLTEEVLDIPEYVVDEEKEIIYFSDHMKYYVKPINSLNSNYITVKYILDRTYDNTNNYYQNDTGHEYQNGIFYPITKKCSDTSCQICNPSTT